MNVTCREVAGTVVVELEGKLIGGMLSDEFHTCIKEQLSQGHKRIVLDLGKTPWATSQGVGSLIGALTSVSNAGGALVLADVPKRIRDILRITRLEMIFTSFASVDEAVEKVHKVEFRGAAAIAAGQHPYN